MGDITNEVLEKHLKKWSIKANIIAVLSAICFAATFAYGFYYETNSQLDQNTVDIKEIKTDVNEINEKVTNSTVFQSVTDVEMNNFDDRLRKIEESQNRTSDKVDKVLEILANQQH